MFPQALVEHKGTISRNIDRAKKFLRSFKSSKCVNDSTCVTDAPFAFEHDDGSVISRNDVQNSFVSISVVAQYYQYYPLP